MSSPFEGLEPKVVWENFEVLTRIPRPSGHEEKIRQHILDWASQRGFATQVDAVGNVVIRVPGSAGRENAPTVVLQGHLDMVCEKNQDVEFDFMTQPLPVVRDGDWLKTAGTTLGADNGIGVAMAMAVAEDPDAAHGPLELLFTVDEESGLTGASNMGPGLLTGKVLINIDSEEEGYLFVGCAGGGDTETRFPLELTPLEGGREVARIKVRGLNGGHSGLTIHENRGNALKILANLLHPGGLQGGQLCHLQGGDKHNAIPREAEAIVAGGPDTVSRLSSLAVSRKSDFMQEFGRKEPGLTIEVEPDSATTALSLADTSRLLSLLLALPHGVDTMSTDIPGLVETSTNLARVLWKNDVAEILSSSRSSIAPALQRLRASIQATAGLAGAEVVEHDAYPGWKPDMDSPLLAKARALYEEMTGKAPEVTAIHAGLECGIIGEAYPGMDMISIGPDMFDVHSPKERLSISSTARFYPYLRALIASL